jgi:hypothetical protein
MFRLSLPDEWEESTVFTFIGPHDSGVHHNLTVVVNTLHEPVPILPKYAKEQVRVSTAGLPGCEILNEQETRMPAGIPMYVVVYKYSASDQQTLYQKQYFLIHDGKAYTFTSTFSKKTLQTIAYDVDKIVASFKI